MIIKKNYYFQKKEKSLKIFTIKGLIKIEEMNNEIDYYDLDYVALSSDMEYNFSVEKDPISLLNTIKEGEISLKEAKSRQKDYLYHLNIIRKGYKNPVQKKTLSNIENHFNARESAIKFIEDYGSIILEAKRLAREEQKGTRANEKLKILTSNQMLKRLPIALAQVKAGNNSENLLNEIRQIVYSFYRSKEVTKKVNNNIINSIKVYT